MRRRREELAAELDAREAQGFLLLDWLPGECQVDFGQADFRVRGVVTRGHFLVVTFPHSNVGLAQVFWGETAECVCQGLRDVFEFLGGVPLRAVFDNATEVGRRVGTEIRTSAIFRRFAAHYGLDYSFTNPYSGNEKGSVENKVGALRRNLFVPVPQVWDVKAYNGRLLDACLGLSDGKPHYRRGIPESELFEADRAALWQALEDGVKFTIGTDDCAFYLSQKRASDRFDEVPGGMPGIETRMPLLLSEGTGKGRFGYERLAHLTAADVAKLYGIYPQKGAIAVGSDADLILVEPCEPYPLTIAGLHEKTDYTPFEGWPLTARIRMTLARGCVVAEDPCMADIGILASTDLRAHRRDLSAVPRAARRVIEENHLYER